MAGGLDIGTLSGKVELEDNMSSKLDILIDKVDKFEGHYSEMGKGVAAQAASFFTAQAAYDAVVSSVEAGIEVFKDMTMEGARISDVEENFHNLTVQAGQLGETLVGSLREGLHNTVTDFELMKTVNNNLASGLALTDQNYKDLAEGGFALAQAKGLDVKEAFEEINTAMFTGRTRQIQYLTGKIDLAGAEDAYAEKLHTTADRLTSEQKIEAARVAILDKVREATARLGEQQDGLDEKVEQAKTRWGNFYEELSKGIATSPEVIKAFDDIQGAISSAFGEDKNTLIKKITAEVASLATTAASTFKTITEVASGTITVLRDNQGVIEAGATALGGYYIATTLVSGGATLLKGVLTGVSTVMAEVTAGSIAASGGLIGAAAALGAFVGYKIGQLQPVSDFFQGLALNVMGYSNAEVEAMIATDHANQQAIESGEAAKQQEEQAAEAAKHHADAALAAANAEKIKAEEQAKAAEAQRLSTAELKAYLDAWKDLNSIGGTWQETLATIDQATRDSAQYYLNLGASVKEVQAAFLLTGEQAKALAQDLKTQQSAVEFLDQAWTQYYQDQADLMATDAEKANNAALYKYNAAVKKLQDMGDDNVDHYNQLWDLYTKDVQQAEQANVVKDTNSKAHLDIQVREQEQTLERMLLNTNNYNQNQIQAQTEIVRKLHEQQQAWQSVGDSITDNTAKTTKMRDEVDKLSKSVNTFSNGWTDIFGNPVTSVTQDVTSQNFYQVVASLHIDAGYATQLAKLGYSLSEIVAIQRNSGGGPIPPPRGPRIPGFREGGIGDFGDGTLAMLHGKEAIVPLDKMASAGLAGPAVNLVFNVNGTGVQVAQQVKEIIMRELKSVRQFGSA